MIRFIFVYPRIQWQKKKIVRQKKNIYDKLYMCKWINEPFVGLV